MDSDPHIFSLALARKIGIKNWEETGKPVLDCVNSSGEGANFDKNTECPLQQDKEVFMIEKSCSE